LSANIVTHEPIVEDWMLETEWITEKDIVIETWMLDNETWNVSLDK
jgi:hypothetical protein